MHRQMVIRLALRAPSHPRGKLSSVQLSAVILALAINFMNITLQVKISKPYSPNLAVVWLVGIQKR